MTKRIRKAIRRTGKRRLYGRKRSFKRRLLRKGNRQVRLYRSIGGEIKTMVLNFTYTGAHSFFYIPFIRAMSLIGNAGTKNLQGYQEFSYTFTNPAL